MTRRHTRKTNKYRAPQTPIVARQPLGCHGSPDALRFHGVTDLKLLAQMPGRRKPMDGGQRRELSVEDTLKDLRATSRMVTTELRRLQQQDKRANDRHTSPVSRYHRLVRRSMARQTSAQIPACLAYPFQHCDLWVDIARDQLHVVDIESCATHTSRQPRCRASTSLMRAASACASATALGEQLQPTWQT